MYVNVQRNPAGPSSRLSFMQFNTLGHRKDPAALKEFPPRLALNLSHICQLRPSIAVLEEVDHIPDYADPLKGSGYVLASSAAKNSEIADSTCVFYDSSVGIELIHQQVIRFKNEDGTEASQFALLCQFTFQSQPFLLVAQHAKAGRTDEGEATRVRHSQQLFVELENFFRTPAGDGLRGRIVWIGDMNASAQTKSTDCQYPCVWYPWVTGAATPTGSTPCPFPFRSAMKEAYNGTEPVTTCKMRDGKLLCHTIDYIFYTEGLFKVVGFARLPTPEELKPHYLPNASWGSDHLALYVEVVFAE